MKATKPISEAERLLADAKDNDAAANECEKAAAGLDSQAKDLRSQRDKHTARAAALRKQASAKDAAQPAQPQPEETKP